MAREIPQYVSQLAMGSMPQVNYTNAGANSLRNVSAELGTMAEDMRRKSTEITDLEIETSYKENLHRIYNENRSNPAGFDAAYGEFYKKFSAEAPATDYKQKLDIQHNLYAQSYRDRVMQDYDSNLEDDYKTKQLKTLTVNKTLLSDAFKQLESAETPEARQSAMAMIQDLNERDAAILSSKDKYGRNRYSPEAQVRDLQERGKMAFEALPAAKRLEVLGEGLGGWEAAQQAVRKHEGGYNPVDGNTGEPALFGINRKWHPEGYAKVEAIYKAQGQQAGQQAADAYLKATYWDKYGLDSLDARQQGIVYDGAVNHRTEFVNELVAAAKSGASTSELLNMRQQEYDRLAASGKYAKSDVASWNNRLKTFQHLAITDYEQYVDPDTKDALLKDARNEVIAEIKMKREDPVKASLLLGARTIDDIVASQLVPKQFARVMDNETALTTAADIEKASTADDILAVAGNIQQTYGEYADNAIYDLKTQGKMRTELEGAITLATEGRPEYKEHIDLLVRTAKAGDKALDAEYKAAGYDPKMLALKLPSDYQDMKRALYNEGLDFEQINEKERVALNLAKAKMIAGNASYSESLEFALKPFKDKYVVGEVNGEFFRVPAKYDADIIQDAVDELIESKIPADVTVTADKNYVYNSKNVYAVLNRDEDSISFKTPLAGYLADKNGQVLRYKLSDLQGEKKTRPRYSDYKQGVRSVREGF
jgi:hypothetical protein